jgi:hypothetical protein
MEQNINTIGRVIEMGEYFLHPITLKIGYNEKNPIVPTTPYYENGKFKLHSNNITNNKLTHLDFQKFMGVPNLNLNIKDILHFYNIITIDDLMNEINKMTDSNKEFQTINRLINLWIKLEYNNLINNYKILITIYNKLGKKYYPDVDLSNINKQIKEWFNNINLEDFDFNLGNFLFNII